MNPTEEKEQGILEDEAIIGVYRKKTLGERLLGLAQKGMDKLNETNVEFRKAQYQLSRYDNERLLQIMKNDSRMVYRGAAKAILVRRGVIKQWKV